MSGLANRVFFLAGRVKIWQAANFFGGRAFGAKRPPIFFLAAANFLGADREFFFRRPPIDLNERFGKPRFFLAGRV